MDPEGLWGPQSWVAKEWTTERLKQSQRGKISTVRLLSLGSGLGQSAPSTLGLHCTATGCTSGLFFSYPRRDPKKKDPNQGPLSWAVL